ncbi:hypothetical protein [Streptomyces sp. B21-083]|uniref:hypothetical protein n=1 Tax=Streptomyces sp. B21-083 TaxID=3039410 RepID=UPI002FF420DD
MTAPQNFPGPPVDLPIDDWLYEAKPKAGCTACSELKAALDRAAKQGDATARFEAARNIRHCTHDAIE